MIHDSEILDDHMDAGSDTGLGAVQVTNDGFVKKVLVSFPKQAMVLQNEVAEEFTWPPRPVIEGETFRISRSSSGIRKGVAHTPVQKHWPEENSMSEELKSAELYGTVLKVAVFVGSGNVVITPFGTFALRACIVPTTPASIPVGPSSSSGPKGKPLAPNKP